MEDLDQAHAHRDDPYAAHNAEVDRLEAAWLDWARAHQELYGANHWTGDQWDLLARAFAAGWRSGRLPVPGSDRAAGQRDAAAPEPIRPGQRWVNRLDPRWIVTVRFVDDNREPPEVYSDAGLCSAESFRRLFTRLPDAQEDGNG